MGQAIVTSADSTRALLEHRIQKWGRTDEQFQGLIIEQIRTTIEAKIAQEGESVLRE